MKLFEAIEASPCKAAVRLLTDGSARKGEQPNIALRDARTDGFRSAAIKAFRAVEYCAWERRPLAKAKKFSDWEPSQDRNLPRLPE